MGFFDKLKGKLGGLFVEGERVNDGFYDELEESLILSDTGAVLAGEIVEGLRSRCKKEGIKLRQDARAVLKTQLTELLESAGSREMNLATRPSVVLMIGVNGAGKTTSAGKLSARLSGEGKRVLLCAADTFRAAAADQLEIWAQRAGVGIVRQQEGADPASVLFDAVNAARARGIDVVLCDTAGRLQNKQNLMNELNKISRVLDRELPGASRETLLALDATTGQNGLLQVREFAAAAGLTGIILTKLDGTAKGGVILAVARETGVPVKWVGVGEQIGDFAPFDPAAFIEAIV
ncbi:MAG: signal recognition particle-docking protein FtsY [Oscillospiraceae bacterium]|jgi:fused signal recognition particle receptor|nr:signal recognition particle-docking protein FtsY [Oscillospiraceae bacterium]